jgi:5-(aminomethyl)-3-furanmethanol phosphate kinase
VKELIVVKLGGSFAASRELRSWLGAITQGAGRAALVPGGGPFADAVRATQQSMGFDDKAAHALALAAMRQYGLALCAIEPCFAPAETPSDFADTLKARRVPVWLPETMALADPAIPASWDVTSDSLALRLASQLGARGVVLVKQIDRTQAAAWRQAESDIVDRAFPAFLAKAAIPAWLACNGDREALGAALASGHMEGLVAIKAQSPTPEVKPR